MSSPQVWLITGTSTGIGRFLAEAALKRGDKVIATARARSLAKLDDLKARGADTLELDVTDTPENLGRIVKEAVAIHGRIDVLVNNAGYVLAGPIEENTAEETYEIFNTHILGALTLTRAILPYMREQKTGTIFWIGSITAWGPVPFLGVYAATKHAMRGISETLHEEISPFGLRSICLDFGYVRTSILTADHRKSYESRIPDYAEQAQRGEAFLQSYHNNQPGDAVRAVEIIVDMAHGEGVMKGKKVPTSLPLGSDCYNTVYEATQQAIAGLGEWKEVIKSIDF